MEIIPAIDLRGGNVVQLEQGDYARESVYGHDPAAAAQRWLESGATRIHVVDLDGARDGGEGNQAAIRAIVAEASAASVPVQVGGGIRSVSRVETVLGWGVQRVILGTAALENPELVVHAATANPDRVILGLDARDGFVATHGWKSDSARSVTSVLEEFTTLPLGAILHTDIGRDGMLSGPNVEATAELARATSIPVLASGGVSSSEDLLALARTRVIAGAIVGTALYTGRIDLEAALREIASC